MEKTLISSNQQPPAGKICRICGDIARGLNFNVMSCMSCKSFFRRNAYKKSLTSQCQFEHNCSITQRTRSYCSPCRLRKCFELGMEPTLIHRTTDSNMVSKKAKRIEKLNKKQITLLAPMPLGLLQNDRSTLTSYEWTLLSNILQAFDKSDPSMGIRLTLDKLSGMPIKLRLKPLELMSVFRELYSCIGPIVQGSSDFNTLPIDDRQILVKNNLYIGGVFNGIFLSRELNVFTNPAVQWICNRIYGSEQMFYFFRNAARLDSNGILVKILVFVLFFSTNCSIVNYNAQEATLLVKSSMNLFHVQNTYVTMLWKYLVYQNGFHAAIIRFSRLVKNLLDVVALVHQTPPTQITDPVMNTIVKKTELILTMNE